MPVHSTHTTQMDTNGTLQRAQEFVYSNGKEQPPTAINIEKSLLKHLLFNQSPSKVGLVQPSRSYHEILVFSELGSNSTSLCSWFLKDVSLASVSMRPIPFAPVLEKLVLTEEKYGSVRRFYVETTEDNAIPLHLQQGMCDMNPPEKVLRLKGSDHAPFFSKPQALHKTLVEIATMPPVKASWELGFLPSGFKAGDWLIAIVVQLLLVCNMLRMGV